MPEAGVGMDLHAENGTVAVGGQFELQVRVMARFTQPVDTAQVYLEYDPAVLEVVAITPGLALEQELQSRGDNARGELSFAAITLYEPVTYEFILCSALFQVKAAPNFGVTHLGFTDAKPGGHTMAILRGTNVTGALSGVNVVVR